MRIQSRGMCRTCYRHQLFIENPVYAETRRAQQRESKRQRRLNDEAWREKERARDRNRTRAPLTGTCTLCSEEGCVAKGLCRRCYSRTNMQERRTDPQLRDLERARSAKRARINTDAIREAKDAPCTDCGGSFPPECMDFDHVRGAKLFNLSSCGTRNPDVVAEEIGKCDLICANCHRIRTRARTKARGRNGMC